ncbi:MAG: hypothetical protein RBU45_03315 [Myxococcota bacterium]|jgi:ribosome modulation factor|nr:hypothetical protein [Myxococcota bacterium]
MNKPTTAVGYDAGLAAEARRLCIYTGADGRTHSSSWRSLVSSS